MQHVYINLPVRYVYKYRDKTRYQMVDKQRIFWWGLTFLIVAVSLILAIMSINNIINEFSNIKVDSTSILPAPDYSNLMLGGICLLFCLAGIICIKKLIHIETTGRDPHMETRKALLQASEAVSVNLEETDKSERWKRIEI